MKLTHYDDVQHFVDAVPADRRPLFDRLRVLVEEMYPDAELALRYQVPTYKTKTGRLSLGHWKGGVSIYPGGAIAEAFEAAHPGYKAGKGTIHLRLGEELPLEALRDVIRRAMEGRGP
jgi:uncharacterized protein YdhG (YjbR/CyaY superfamily)